VNIYVNKNLKKIILLYSDKKIKEKRRLLYSVLNPETNSDSLSEKSNGVRFNSTINETTTKKNIGTLKNIKIENFWYLGNSFKFKDIRIKK